MLWLHRPGERLHVVCFSKWHLQSSWASAPHHVSLSWVRQCILVPDVVYRIFSPRPQSLSKFHMDQPPPFPTKECQLHAACREFAAGGIPNACQTGLKKNTRPCCISNFARVAAGLKTEPPLPSTFTADGFHPRFRV